MSNNELDICLEIFWKVSFETKEPNLQKKLDFARRKKKNQKISGKLLLHYLFIDRFRVRHALPILVSHFYVLLVRWRKKRQRVSIAFTIQKNNDEDILMQIWDQRKVNRAQFCSVFFKFQSKRRRRQVLDSNWPWKLL